VPRPAGGDAAPADPWFYGRDLKCVQQLFAVDTPDGNGVRGSNTDMATVRGELKVVDRFDRDGESSQRFQPVGHLVLEASACGWVAHGRQGYAGGVV
jgi:hypothetical protein